MFRFIVVACLCYCAVDALRPCNRSDIKIVVGCIMKKFDALETGCSMGNRCPSWGGSDNRGHQKRRKRDVSGGASGQAESGEGSSEEKDDPTTLSRKDMNNCTAGVMNLMTSLVNGCVRKSISGFSFPDDSDYDGDHEQHPKNNYTDQTCKHDSADACLTGREGRDQLFYYRDQCISLLNGVCDVSATSKLMCGCYDANINMALASRLVDNFTNCLQGRKPHCNVKKVLNITDADKEHFIKEQRAQVCIMEPFPKNQGCGADEVDYMTQCVMRRMSSVDNCYRAANCPLANANDTGNHYDDDTINKMNPFAKYPNKTKVDQCGIKALGDAMKRLVQEVQKTIPNFRINLDNHGQDHNDNNQGDHSHGNGNNQGGNGNNQGGNGNNQGGNGNNQGGNGNNQGGNGNNNGGNGNRGGNGNNYGWNNTNQGNRTCDKEALSYCLADRNLPIPHNSLCGHEKTCTYTCNSCDVEYTKGVLCQAAKKIFQTDFETLKSQMYACLGVKESAYPISKLVADYWTGQATQQFCNCPASAVATVMTTIKPAARPAAQATTKTTPKPTPKPTTKPAAKPTTKKH